MRVYTNSAGITCVEPSEGYLLKKNGQLYKKVYLGKNDRAELYEEVVDKEYIPEERKENDITGAINIINNCVLVSPNGRQFKLIVSDDGTLSTKEI